MERVLFERAKCGYRAVRGDLVRTIQTRLKANGADPGEVDGIYGRDTESALKQWQAACGMAGSGRLCVASWSELVEAPLPSMLERCLQLTSDFEGHGYGKVVGNFDGAWLTWGIIGFTLRNGEIQKILAKVRSEHPGLLRDVLGPLEGVLLRMLAGGTDTQEGWANDISVGSNHYRVLPEWEEAFANLGMCPEVRRIQLEGVEKYWQLALRTAATVRPEERARPGPVLRHRRAERRHQPGRGKAHPPAVRRDCRRPANSTGAWSSPTSSPKTASRGSSRTCACASGPSPWAKAPCMALAMPPATGASTSSTPELKPFAGAPLSRVPVEALDLRLLPR